MKKDPANDKTEIILRKLEKKIHDEYAKALEDADKRWREYLSAFEKQDKIEAKRLADGEITKQQYQEWRKRHLAQGKQWEEMRDTIAGDLHNSNLIAARLANGSMADVYALNANFGTYLVEKSGKISTGFTLYNHDSAEALLKEEWKISRQTGRNSFLPKPSAKKQRELDGLKSKNPDILWNARNIQSAMFQSILIGETIPDIAKRLASVAVMDEHQAIRNARTLTTNVQNKGRMDSFDRAAKLGVELVDEWNSILDGRTRHSHRHMHGERRPHDSKKPFSNGCMYPGDPQAPAAEVYNCRCRLVSWVKGFEGETVKYNEAMGNMSFEEWQEANAPKKGGSVSTEKESKTKDSDNFPVADVSVDNAAVESYNNIQATESKSDLPLEPPEAEKPTATEKAKIQEEPAEKGSESQAQAKTVPAITETDESKFSSLINKEKGMNKSYSSALNDRYAKGTEEAKKVFNKFVSSDSVADSAYNGDEFRPWEKKIYMNYAGDLKAKTGAGTSFFHEHGHYIDFMAAGASNDRQLSTSNSTFGALLRSDYSEYVSQYKKQHGMKAKEAYRAISDDLAGHDKNGVSDIFCGLSDRKAYGWYGHSKSYYADPGHIEQEAFANMYEACFDPDKYRIMQKYLPNAFSEFENMLKGIL